MSSRIALILILAGCGNDAGHQQDLSEIPTDASEAARDLEQQSFDLSPAVDSAPAGALDGGEMDLGMATDLAGSCFIATTGESGECKNTANCAGPTYTATPGYCPGAVNIQCCALTPDINNNPPTPAGWTPMKDAEVTPDMSTWAVMILHDPTDYPMFATTTRMFGTLLVLARVEWHPKDSINPSGVHRGVTLYKPAP
jgi:hypothetical protein